MASPLPAPGAPPLLTRARVAAVTLVAWTRRATGSICTVSVDSLGRQHQVQACMHLKCSSECVCPCVTCSEAVAASMCCAGTIPYTLSCAACTPSSRYELPVQQGRLVSCCWADDPTCFGCRCCAGRGNSQGESWSRAHPPPPAALGTCRMQYSPPRWKSAEPVPATPAPKLYVVISVSWLECLSPCQPKDYAC
jgi:hypothetical protein